MSNKQKWRAARRYYTPLRAAIELMYALLHKRNIRHPRELKTV